MNLITNQLFNNINLELPYPQWTGEDGSQYIGQVKQGKPDGFGILTYPSEHERNSYDGEFQNGLPHGEGRVVWKNGDTFEGMFRNNKMNGKGILTLANGTKKEGNFIDNRLSGQVHITYVDGSEYIGEYQNDTHEGIGKITHRNGNSFSGTFKNGKEWDGQLFVIQRPDNVVFVIPYENGRPKKGRCSSCMQNCTLV